ncbi:MAG: hypothetical protein V4661_00165 [Pseudomonadota bacterium]
MKKILVASACALALSLTGAMAQTGQPAAKSPSPTMQPESNKIAPGADSMTPGSNSSETTGRSMQDRKTVPGSLEAGGTSQSSPNTVQPGASKSGK